MANSTSHVAGFRRAVASGGVRRAAVALLVAMCLYVVGAIACVGGPLSSEPALAKDWGSFRNVKVGDVIEVGDTFTFENQASLPGGVLHSGVGNQDICFFFYAVRDGYPGHVADHIVRFTYGSGTDTDQYTFKDLAFTTFPVSYQLKLEQHVTLHEYRKGMVYRINEVAGEAGQYQYVYDVTANAVGAIFDSNGGTHTGPETLVTSELGGTITLPGEEFAGEWNGDGDYEFVGWGTTRECPDDEILNPGDSYKPITEAYVELFAQWRKKVDFVSGIKGTTSETTTSLTQKASRPGNSVDGYTWHYSNVTAPETPAAAVAGATARPGWYAADTLDGTTAPLVQGGASFSPTQRTYYALCGTDATFTQGLDSTSPTQTTVGYYYNSSGASSSINAPAISDVAGWTTLYWTSDSTADGSSNQIPSGQENVQLHASQYYARYSRAATFRSGVAAPADSTLTQYYNASGTTSSGKIPTPATEGSWPFAGWTTGEAADAGISSTVVADDDYNADYPIVPGTYYARYDKTATFHTDGTCEGSETTATQSFNSAGSGAYSSGNVPSLDATGPGAAAGWTVVGWKAATNAAPGIAFEGGAAFNEATPLAEADYYALMSKTPTFVAGDKGTLPSATPVTQYRNANGAFSQVTAPTPTAAGLWSTTGLGWTSAEGADAATSDGLAYGASTNSELAATTYYARYRATATFSTGGAGTASATSVSQDYSANGDAYSTGTFPTVETQHGWATDGLGWTTGTVTDSAIDVAYGALFDSANPIGASAYNGVFSRELAVDYDDYEATSGDAPEPSIATQRYNASGAITQPSVELAANGGTLVREGHRLTGWDVTVGTGPGAFHRFGETFSWTAAATSDVADVTPQAKPHWVLNTYDHDVSAADEDIHANDAVITPEQLAALQEMDPEDQFAWILDATSAFAENTGDGSHVDIVAGRSDVSELTGATGEGNYTITLSTEAGSTVRPTVIVRDAHGEGGATTSEEVWANDIELSIEEARGLVEAPETAEALLVERSSAGARNVETREPLRVSLVSSAIQPERGAYPVVFGAPDGTTVQVTAFVKDADATDPVQRDPETGEPVSGTGEGIAANTFWLGVRDEGYTPAEIIEAAMAHAWELEGGRAVEVHVGGISDNFDWTKTGAYEVIFSTDKGTSCTVTMYLRDEGGRGGDPETGSGEGIAANDVYVSPGGTRPTDQELIDGSGARAWDMETGAIVPITHVTVPEDVDWTKPGEYPVTFSTDEGTSVTTVIHVFDHEGKGGTDPSDPKATGETIVADDVTISKDEVKSISDEELIDIARAVAHDDATGAEVDVSVVGRDKVGEEPGEYEITFTTDKGTSVTVKVTVTDGAASDNGKRLTANDIHMSVAEAAALLASEDADAQLIALANARAVEVGTGASLEVEVADRSALVAEPGEYPVTFKTNPELTVTAYVEDGGSQPGGDAGGDAGEAAAADRRAAESARGGIAETGDSASWMLGVALVMAIASIGALSLGIRSRRGAIG